MQIALAVAARGWQSMQANFSKTVGSMQQRLLGADFLRAVACLLVLAHHLAFRIGNDKVPEALRPLHSFLVMGSFGVTIFFMLSGFLLARPFWLALDRGEPMPSLGVYALRRAARILPGFWLALTASLLAWIVVWGNGVDAQDAVRFLAGFLLLSDWHYVTLFPVNNNGPLWSIGFEVTSYFLLPFCLAALFSLKLTGWPARLGWLGVVALVLIVHWAIVQWAPIDEVDRGWDHGLVGGAKAWMPRFNPIGFFAIFAVGAFASGVQVLIARLSGWWFDALGLGAIVVGGWIMAANIGGLNEGFGWLGIPYAFPWMPLAVGVALVALPSSILAGKLLDNRVARFIAEISFGIYVWHFLVMGLVERLVPSAFDTGGEEAFTVWLWSSAMTIASSFLVATLSFYLLERPIVRWARGQEDKFGGRASSITSSAMRSRG